MLHLTFHKAQSDAASWLTVIDTYVLPSVKAHRESKRSCSRAASKTDFIDGPSLLEMKQTNKQTKEQ